MSHIMLYDLPSRDRNACWSLNPWKTRLALNYKGVEYTTEWVEYPDIAPKFKAAEIAPNPQNQTSYTIPTIKTRDGKYIMDSAKIIQYLEAEYPEPSLHIDSGMPEVVQQLVIETRTALNAVIIPEIPIVVLNPVSKVYFEETRKVRFGMPLSQFKVEKGGEAAWQAANEPLGKIVKMLKENRGPYFLGEQVSYADFILVGFLQFSKRADEGIFNRLVDYDKSLADLFEACEPWLKRDDH